MAIDHNAIFLLTSADPDRKKNFGTGFAIAHKDGKLFLLTCAHVVEDIGGKVKVGGLEAEVVAAGLGSSIDLAVLSIPCEKPPPLLNRIALEKKEGDRFQICGYSLFAGAKDSYVLREIEGSLGKSVSFASQNSSRVEAWDIRIEDDEFAKLQGGYSGSPLCDEDGRLIAVVSHSVADGQRGHAISAANLQLICPDIEQMLKLFTGKGRGRKKMFVILALFGFCVIGGGIWLVWLVPDSLVVELNLKYGEEYGGNPEDEYADAVTLPQGNSYVHCRKTETTASVDGKTIKSYVTICFDENRKWGDIPSEPIQPNQYQVIPVPAYQECRRAEIVAVLDGKIERTYSIACRDDNGNWKLQDELKQNLPVSECKKVEIVSVVDGKTKITSPTACRDENGDWQIKDW